MQGLWLNMDTVNEGMVRLIVPCARNLSSIIDTYEVDDDRLNTKIKVLGLARPSARKGRFVAAPPPELVAFLRWAGVEEAVLVACPWPTLVEMRARYLRAVLAHAPSYVVAAETLRYGTGVSLKREAKQLGLPELAFQRKGTMRPAPKEWVALHPLLCPPAANFCQPTSFRTVTDNRPRLDVEPETTTRWILPEQVKEELRPDQQHAAN